MRQWRDGLETLPPLEKAEALTALMDYALDGKPYTGINGAVKMFFAMITKQIDEHNAKYQEICEKRSRSASERWEKQKQANASNSMQMQTKADKSTHLHTDNDSDSDCDNDCVCDSDCDSDINKKKNTPIGVSKEKPARFIKPTLDEVKAYCQEKGYTWDVEYFYDYYESNGWKVGRNVMKDWKATVRNWNKNEKERKQNKDYELQRRQWETRRHEGAVSDFANLTPEDEQF